MSDRSELTAKSRPGGRSTIQRSSDLSDSVCRLSGAMEAVPPGTERRTGAQTRTPDSRRGRTEADVELVVSAPESLLTPAVLSVLEEILRVEDDLAAPDNQAG